MLILIKGSKFWILFYKVKGPNKQLGGLMRSLQEKEESQN